MAKKNKNIWILVTVLLVGALILGNQLGYFSTSGASMSRSAPSTVSPGQSFTVTYTASSQDSQWGASIVDRVSGGCKFPDGSNEIKTVMLSVDGNSKPITIKAPSSGSCTFSGDYKFGEDNTVNFQSKTVTVQGGGSCTTGQTKCESTTAYNCVGNAWVSQGELHGRCGFTDCQGLTYDITDNECVEVTCTGLGEYDTLALCEEALDGSGTPSFEWGMVLFEIGDFEVTLMILLISFGSLFVIKMVFSK